MDDTETVADAVGWLRKIYGKFGESQRALGNIEGESIGFDPSLVHQLHAGAIEVFLRRLSAVALLIRNEKALEADALVRGMLELAVTVTWVGQSEERASKIRAKGANQSKVLFERVNKHVASIEVSDADLARAERLVDDEGWPKQIYLIFEECGLLDLYAETYTRLCSPSHADWWHLEKVFDEPNVNATTRGVMQASELVLKAIRSWFPQGQTMVDELQAITSPPTESTQPTSTPPEPGA